MFTCYALHSCKKLLDRTAPEDFLQMGQALQALRVAQMCNVKAFHVFVCVVVTGMVVKVKVLFYGGFFFLGMIRERAAQLRHRWVTMSRGQRPSGLSGPTRPKTLASLGHVRCRLRESLCSLQRTEGRDRCTVINRRLD